MIGGGGAGCRLKLGLQAPITVVEVEEGRAEQLRAAHGADAAVGQARRGLLHLLRRYLRRSYLYRCLCRCLHLHLCLWFVDNISTFTAFKD